LLTYQNDHSRSLYLRGGCCHPYGTGHGLLENPGARQSEETVVKGFPDVFAARFRCESCQLQFLPAKYTGRISQFLDRSSGK
jgi:hypothetical protein